MFCKFRTRIFDYKRNPQQKLLSRKPSLFVPCNTTNPIARKGLLMGGDICFTIGKNKKKSPLKGNFAILLFIT